MSVRRLKGEDDLKTMTFVEKVKFYMSLCLGITALLSVFAFLFLIPFVVNPSISTILANFNPEPVLCLTVNHDYKEGLSNCTWTSCKEGCTNITPRCHQLYVNYSTIPYENWNKKHNLLQNIDWAEGYVKFFINTEGCGYPPRVNCTEFVIKYGLSEGMSIQNFFPCYYSRRYPRERVVAYYNWSDTVKNLFLAVGVPNFLFIFCVSVLCYWYCWPVPYDRRKRTLLDSTYAVNSFPSNLSKGRDLYGYDAEEDDYDYVEQDVGNGNDKDNKYIKPKMN